MKYGSLLTRLVRGARWTWLDESHRGQLPADLEQTIMTLRSDDQHHEKQGRSTARVRFDSPQGNLSVFLKRHYELPWRNRLGALVNPGGKHTPASAEWAHLEHAKALGIPVPEVVGAGEIIGPWGRLKSFLMVAELTGCEPLHEALPKLDADMDPVDFERLKRKLIRRMADITARLHRNHAFHKDLYLCHFFVDMSTLHDARPTLHLIDLHRLAFHRWTAPRWRWKDLGQLLFSTDGVGGVGERDSLRFWKHYRRAMALPRPRLTLRFVRAKAAMYLAHNR